MNAGSNQSAYGVDGDDMMTGGEYLEDEGGDDYLSESDRFSETLDGGSGVDFFIVPEAEFGKNKFEIIRGFRAGNEKITLFFMLILQFNQRLTKVIGVLG